MCFSNLLKLHDKWFDSFDSLIVYECWCRQSVLCNSWQINWSKRMTFTRRTYPANYSATERELMESSILNFLVISSFYLWVTWAHKFQSGLRDFSQSDLVIWVPERPKIYDKKKRVVRGRQNNCKELVYSLQIFHGVRNGGLWNFL